MTTIVNLPNITPPARYDDVPWTQATIEESANGTSSWTVIETVDLDPVDTDPAQPASRSFTTTLGTAASLYYRLTFLDDDANESATTPVVQNTTATTAYADATELAAHLKIRTPTTEQTEDLERVLLAAAGEINSEIARVSLAGWELALAKEVNLERAVEHWQQVASPFGIVGLGDGAATYTARDSWDRHALKLAPLKRVWGLA